MSVKNGTYSQSKSTKQDAYNTYTIPDSFRGSSISITAYFRSKNKELRIKTGMSQDVLASLAGLDRSYVYGIERGERNIWLINIEKTSNALDVDLANGKEVFS